MPSLKQYDTIYMKVAWTISGLSKANRLQVGCVIVDDTNILSYGYNGTPYNNDNKCEISDGENTITKPEVIHGELNALMKLIGKTINSKLTMYVTNSPCLACAIHIYQSKVIKRVVYNIEYRLTDGIDFLIKNGIEVERIDA